MTEISDKAIEAAQAAWRAKSSNYTSSAECWRAALSAALPHLGAAGVAVPAKSTVEALVSHIARVFDDLEVDNGWCPWAFVANARNQIIRSVRSALVPSPVPQEATAEPVAWRGPFTAADAALDELRRAVASTMGYDPETWPTHRNAPLAIAALVALLKGEAGSPPSHDAELLAALRDLRQAVCGETGFASAVREHSGLAYPWPALDIAEAKADAVLSRPALAQEGGRSDGE